MISKGSDIKKIINVAYLAGKQIMSIYNTTDIKIYTKKDKSPITVADKLSEKLILTRFKKFFPEIPIISEESKQVHFKERKKWKYFWLIDPLDGTKEFIKRIPEFTVNISLICQNKPFLGVIYVPSKNELFYAVKNQGAYKIDSQGNKVKIPTTNDKPKDKIIIVATRSHKTKELQDYIERLKKKYREVKYISMGSSLKFCLIAENKAHIYPKLGPTMEWDTAAGQLIVEEAGGRVVDMETNKTLEYNKENLLNNHFAVYGSIYS